MQKSLDAGGAGGIEKHLRAHDVGPQERVRALDAAIDVRLGREVDEGVRSILKSGADGNSVGDVAADKAMALIIDALEIIEIARVSQGIEIGDAPGGTFSQHQTDKRRADEASPACDEKMHDGNRVED